MIKKIMNWGMFWMLFLGSIFPAQAQKNDSEKQQSNNPVTTSLYSTEVPYQTFDFESLLEENKIWVESKPCNASQGSRKTWVQDTMMAEQKNLTIPSSGSAYANEIEQFELSIDTYAIEFSQKPQDQDVLAQVLRLRDQYASSNCPKIYSKTYVIPKQTVENLRSNDLILQFEKKQHQEEGSVFVYTPMPMHKYLTIDANDPSNTNSFVIVIAKYCH